MKVLVICILAALTAGCGVSIRSPSKPAFDNLSGTYRYVGLGSFEPAQFPNALIDFENITNPSEIEVRHEGRIITTLYKSSTGSPVSTTVDLDKETKGISWKNRELVTNKKVPVTGPIILPLPGKHYRGSRLFQNRDGNLVVVGFFEERGLFWTDYDEEEVILERKKD